MSSKEEIRNRIDKIDAQMLKLLSQRAKLAQQVVQYKKVYYDPIREKEIFRRLFSLNAGPLRDDSVKSVYREIISACRELQKPLTVAYLGPRATYSNSAALKVFGSSIVEAPCPDIPSVFDEVEKRKADYGVVPFENSTEGVISFTLDRFVATPLKIVGEVFQEVAIYVLSRESSMANVKKIFAHPKVLEQCADWLRENAHGIEIIQMTSTALTAQQAAKTPKSAALASKIAAELYGLKIIEERIENNRDNKTRFLVIGHEPVKRSGCDKTSVLFSVRHSAGSLYRALKPFEKHKVNLTMMQARPSRNAQWEYNFFVDTQGHQDDDNIKNAFAEMAKETILLKIMGSYPREEQ